MDRIILNKKNYKIWSALVMGKLEEANLEHTVPSNNTTTENTTEGEGTTTINEISARDDSKARRIIYKHLNEPMWEKVGDIDTAYELWNYLKIYDNDEEDEKPKKTTTSKKTTKSSSTNSAKTKTNKSTIVKSTTIKSTTIKSTSIKSTSVKPSPAKKSKDKEESHKDIEDIPHEDDKESNDEKDNEKPKKTTTTKQSGKTTETRESTVTKTTKSTVTKSTTIKSSSTKKPDGYIEFDEENDDLPFEYDNVPYDEEEKGNETIVKASTTECDEENEENDDLPFEYDNVSYDKKGECTMDQTKYIINKLNKHNITGEKNNPYSDITDNDENKHKIDPTKFRSAVGSLIHLARCTRPDISETISKLSTKRNNATVKDWKMVQNVLKYLNKTRNYFLKFNDKEDITTYSDASFGPKDIDDNAKSTTGYIIYIGCAPICWKSKKQKFTARSTTEAEFNATADLIEKIMWLNNLNKEIEGKVLLCQVFCDNISNIKILTNEKRTNSSRHFDIDYSFVMDYIKEDFINMSYVSSNNMLADVLTKRVKKDSFEYFIDNTFFY